MESISNVASQATGPVPSKGKSRTCLAHVYTVGNQATRDENDPCLDQDKGVSKLQMVATVTNGAQGLWVPQKNVPSQEKSPG